MSRQGPRPESITDLPNYDITEDMLDVRLTQDGACNQLLVATDNLIHVLRHAYGDEALTISFDNGRCTVRRTLEAGEQAKILTSRQQEWDTEHEARTAAAERDKLRVGDKIDTTGLKGNCRRDVAKDGVCALDYWHYGQCVAVQDGKVIGTRPGPRQ